MGKAFERVITLQLEKFAPEEAKRRHIAVARRGLAAFLARQAAKPGVVLEVDGHAATSEDEVKPFGVIVYRFTRMKEIALFAKRKWIDLAPVRSGDYRSSLAIFADGAEVKEDAVQENVKEILVVATVPYARKLNVRGARLLSVPPGIAERVRQFVLRKYGSIVDANIDYITLDKGYILKRSTRRAPAGTQVTYPAVLITQRF